MFLNASASTEFIDRLYSEFNESGLDDVDAWLDVRLEGEFKYMKDPPKWVEEEPTWLFHEGRPMIFMSQTYVPFDDAIGTDLLQGATIYLFGIRDVDPNKPMIYRTLDQYEL